MKIEITQLDEEHYYVEVTKVLLKEVAVCHGLNEALEKAADYATDEELEEDVTA